MNGEQVSNSVIFSRKAPAVSCISLLLAVAGIYIITYSGLTDGKNWGWSWFLSLAIIPLTAWKRIWGTFTLGVLIFLFPVIVILFQGF